MNTEPVECNLGELFDISRGGVRLRGRQPLSGVVSICIGSLMLAGRIAWCRKIGSKKFDVGIEFVDLTEQQARALATIATAHRACQAQTR